MSGLGAGVSHGDGTYPERQASRPRRTVHKPNTAICSCFALDLGEDRCILTVP